MTRVPALLCAATALTLTACGSSAPTADTASHPASGSVSAATASSGTASDASTPTSAGAGAPTSASTAADSAPPPPWSGRTAAAQLGASTRPFFAAKNKVTAPVNSFNPANDTEFRAGWPPIAQQCKDAAAQATASAQTISSQVAAHDYPPAVVPSIRRAVREIRWYAHSVTVCTRITSKAQLVGWLLGAVDRWNTMADVIDVPFHKLGSS